MELPGDILPTILAGPSNVLPPPAASVSLICFRFDMCVMQ